MPNAKKLPNEKGFSIRQLFTFILLHPQRLFDWRDIGPADRDLAAVLEGQLIRVIEAGLKFTDHVEVNGEAPVNPDELGGIQLLKQVGQRLLADHPVPALGPNRGYPILGLEIEDRVLLQDNRTLIIGQ